MPPGVAWGNRERIGVTCRAPLSDWANGGCVDVLVTNVVSLRRLNMVLVLYELVLL